jgi:MoxR-like ATPase
MHVLQLSLQFAWRATARRVVSHAVLHRSADLKLRQYAPAPANHQQPAHFILTPPHSRAIYQVLTQCPERLGEPVGAVGPIPIGGHQLFAVSYATMENAMLADLTEELKLLIRSRHPLVAMETPDEERATQLIRRVAEDMRFMLFEWSATTGLRRRLPGTGGMISGTQAPRAALGHACDAEAAALYVFKDLAGHLGDPVLVRTLRDVQTSFSRRQCTLFLIDLPSALPEPVRRLAVPFDVKWPSGRELEQVIRETFGEARLLHNLDVQQQLSPDQFDQLVRALRGLSRNEATRVVSAAIFDDYRLDANDLPRIIEAKRRILAGAGLLESIPVDDVAPEDLGGLARLKAWLARRRGGFSAKARHFGLTPPRGILLLGVQGGGKSLCAKIVASDWELPLLRLDPGVLYQRYVGESESRLRRALSQAEVMAPCVLWVDEIEKAFASASSESADGGLSQRMFGTMLAWMQDRRQPIFLVATANDVSRLPPELLRKGRFDEVFFVDLPTPKAREMIFAIHLRKRGRDPARFDLARLAAAADGFSGAEIEQAVISALYAAYSAEQELTQDLLLDEITQTRPLSVLMAERVADLRSWAAERCVPAD